MHCCFYLHRLWKADIIFVHLSSVLLVTEFLIKISRCLLVVLDVVHDLVDAILMSSKERSGHNWVQAARRNSLIRVVM